MERVYLGRHLSRKLVVYATYAALMYQYAKQPFDPAQLLKDSMALSYLQAKKKSLPGEPQTERIEADLRLAFVKALADQEEIENKIDEFLVDWTFARLSFVSQAIFLVAYSEAAIVKCTPKAVAINEALNLAKELVDAGEAKYMNAVLERSISKALGIPGDYQKVKVEAKDMALSPAAAKYAAEKAQKAKPVPFPQLPKEVG